MSMYKRYQPSKKLTEKGAPLRFPANEDGTVPTLILARAHVSNQLHAAAVARFYTPEVMKAMDEMPEEEAMDLAIEVLLAGSLMGWENITGEDDEPLEFNHDNAVKLFKDLPDVFTSAQMFVRNMNNYLKSAEENAVKN